MSDQRVAQFHVPSFSQSGEDRLVLKLLGNRDAGTYVDVGCHHPVRASNTYLLYLKGWRGLAVDADPQMKELFREFRPEDTFIHSGVGPPADARPFHILPDRALNTFDAGIAEAHRAGDSVGNPVRIEVGVRPLADILEDAGMGVVDFVNIDVEGMDLAVLESHDWQRWRPAVVAVEDHALDPENPAESEVFRFMKAEAYHLVSKCHYTSIYGLEPFAGGLPG